MEIRGCARCPIQRIVVYAHAAPRTPSIAMPTAASLCASVAVSGLARGMIVSATASAAEGVVEFVGEEEAGMEEEAREKM